MKKKQEILITDFDGYNVHNPEKSSEFIEVRTFEHAKKVAQLVRDIGFAQTKMTLEILKETL